MKVPFIDFSQQYQTIKGVVDQGLTRVFEQGCFILGAPERDFEAAFAHYCSVRYGVGVNSGTDALYLALSALDISVGDEVILPTFTFIATALCVSYTGAKPVFVDVDERTYNMDPLKVKAAITKRTKAIIPVHLYGQPADIDEIVSLARERNIAVIEDAAQAHGALYKGRRVGSLADIACFSFYPTKSLGGFGDGGMVVTNSEKVSKRVAMLRDYGREGRYEHKIKGFNSRLDTVQAVVLAAKLPFLDEWNAMRGRTATIYSELLKGVEGIVTPFLKADRSHVYQTFAVRLKNRDAVMEELIKADIGVLIHYPIPVHLQEAYKELGYKKGDFPISEQLASEVLSLPMFPHMTREQVEYVCDQLKKIVKAKR